MVMDARPLFVVVVEVVVVVAYYVMTAQRPAIHRSDFERTRPLIDLV